MFLKERAPAGLSLCPWRDGSDGQAGLSRGQDGDKDGDSPSAAFGRAKSPVPSPGWVQERQSWVCCMELLPLLFEGLREYNLVFPDSYLPHINYGLANTSVLLGKV